ncbi:MAG: tRNA (N6-isopentenyl adenosine(37)-C2)-methylthiotransferase MiaB [Acidobacteriota bacterium]
MQPASNATKGFPSGRPRPPSNKGRYWISTYGCQMNVHDSEIYAGQLDRLGFVPAPAPEEADLILVNTCSVREKAEDKLFSELGRLRRLKGSRTDARANRETSTGLADAPALPGSVTIGVTGCIAQQRGAQILEREGSVDFVLGTRAIRALPSVLETLANGAGPQVITDDLVDFDASAARRQDFVKAFVTIMEGCNNYCSFCIVPQTRGLEIYRPAADIIDEVLGLGLRGYREVTLLGQNVNSWIDPDSGMSFPELLRRLDRVLSEADANRIERIRFLTPHPKDLSADCIAAMADCSKVAKHIHLPVQSGSDAVLRRMNRHYTREGYLQLVDSLRRALPGVGLSTDLIVGYPGESERDYEATLELVRQAHYDSVYAFEYSPRPGTSAMREESTVPAAIKRRRLIQLQQLQRHLQLESHSAWHGRTVEILVDSVSKRSRDDLSGRTSRNQIVNFAGHPRLIGHLVNVRITGSGANSLYGLRLNAPAWRALPRDQRKPTPRRPDA